MLLTSPVALLFSLVLGMSASAAPVVLSLGQLSRRDVWAPKVTNPDGGTIWHIGSEATVTWYVQVVLRAFNVDLGPPF